MQNELKKTLTTLQLWGIAVGLVISGEYFGWSYGWASAGTLGFIVTSLFVAAMYTTFIFSFTELTTSIPHAGGPFAYARAGIGETGGYIAGMATLIEFVFAPPAIALAIGAYLNVQFPELQPRTAAVAAYAIFMALNILGVSIAATFELVVTLFAIFELLVFMGVVAPGFSWAHFSAGGWAGSQDFSPKAVAGIFAAIPFAIWFFLAIEGVAMAAEEAKDPKRSIPRAYISGILTLVALAIGVMIFAGGAGDWTRLANINDPLPQAMRYIVGDNSGWLHMLVWLGLFGLVASFHGIIIGYSRQIFALGRAGYLPAVLARVHPRFRTPHWAIVAGGIVGVAAIYSDELIVIGGQPLTANIVTMSVFGAITMYITSMISLFRLRKNRPEMERPFTAPLYPWFPGFAIGAATICLAAMVYYNFTMALIFVAFLAVGYAYFRATAARRALPPILPEIIRREAAGPGPNFVIVCEHASNAFPPEFGDLGLDPAARQSHIAWDPGAIGVAREIRRALDADLVAASVSRLLYDCNRPPEAPSAIAEDSEIYRIPGNRGLTARDRQIRMEAIYAPFRAALADVLDARGSGILVTVHSFTPVYHGVRRRCEIGILHDSDSRLADAMLAEEFPYKLERNVPYSAEDGVTHTLREHALPRFWPNVMIEIRNDLIETPAQQAEMAMHLAALLSKAAENE